MDDSIMSNDNTKFTDLESKISELTESHKKVTGDYEFIQVQNYMLSNTMEQQIKTLTSHISKIIDSIQLKNDTFTSESRKLQDEVHTLITQQRQQIKSLITSLKE